MTYRELMQKLLKANSKVLDQTVTVFNEHNEEFYGCTGSDTCLENDVLDDGHFFLMVNI